MNSYKVLGFVKNKISLIEYIMIWHDATWYNVTIWSRKILQNYYLFGNFWNSNFVCHFLFVFDYDRIFYVVVILYIFSIQGISSWKMGISGINFVPTGLIAQLGSVYTHSFCLKYVSGNV